MKKSMVIVILSVFLLLVSISFSQNNNIPNKVDKDILKELKKNSEVSVIIILNEYTAQGVSASSVNNKNSFEKKKEMISKQQDKVLSNLKLKNNKQAGIMASGNSHDFDLKHKYNVINGFSGKITQQGLNKLANNQDVKYIELDRPVSISLDIAKSHVNATNTWKLIYNGTNLTGKHETVCVIDTGVNYNHSALGDDWGVKVIGGYRSLSNGADQVECSSSQASCFDDHSHGTHVTGIVASTNETYTGIAPDTKIIAVKTLDSGGSGFASDTVSGINWCVNNASKFNISIISMSLGGSTNYSGHCNDVETSYATAIDAAYAQNISVIVAAGNSYNYSAMSAPACIANATSVGALNDNDVIQSFSNRNGNTSLFAPGLNIDSASHTGGFTPKRGTSMATPIVSGAFAILRQYFRLTENRNATPDEIEDYLNDSGKQIADPSNGLTYSRINIFAAIESLDTGSPRITIVIPENNTAKTNISFIVNISSSEVLSNVTLEINNTNFTMAGSGLNWNVNISSLINGTYTYKIYGNDTFGNSNFSETRTVNIDLIPPYWGGNTTNISNPKTNDVIQFNITWNDTVALSWYIFSWNDTSTWNNLTNGSLSGKTQQLSINKTITASNGNVIGYQFYANDSVGNWNETDTFTITIGNTAPSASLTINSTDLLNRTNGTLTGSWIFSDEDEDSIADNETKWYNSTEEVLQLINSTSVSPQNTTKGQNWTFSARVYDGTNWGSWVNSTNLTIQNAVPEINITINNIVADNVTLNETQKVNITTNASDIDNDALTFTINDSRFSLNGIYYTWDTSLTDSGTYYVNITVNDTENIDSKIITVYVIDARDLDNDGNPDFNDTDDDNDGILDTTDYLSGNLSNINTTLTINITVNGTSNLSKLFNGTFPINITNGSMPIIEFNFTFNENNTLDLGSITFNRTTNGSSAVSIRGLNLTSIGKTKTIYLEKLNSTVDSVCIKDLDIDYNSIISACDQTNEVLLDCDNVSSSGYTCFDTGTRYKITGLNHSAIKEQCRDVDGDGYGVGCAAGTDCSDTDSSKTTSCSSSTSSSSGGGGGGGGGSGGGGGAVSTSPQKSQYYQSISQGQVTDMNINKEIISFSKVSFTVNKNLEKVTITVKTLTKNSTPYTIPKNAYQYIEIKLDKISDKDINNAEIEFNINKSWLNKNKFDKNTVVLNRYNNGWGRLSTKKTKENKNNITYKAESPGFSVFAITASKIEVKEDVNLLNRTTEEPLTKEINEKITNIETVKPKKKEPKGKLLLGLLIIALIIIIGLIIYNRFFGIKHLKTKIRKIKEEGKHIPDKVKIGAKKHEHHHKSHNKPHDGHKLHHHKQQHKKH